MPCTSEPATICPEGLMSKELTLPPPSMRRFTNCGPDEVAEPESVAWKVSALDTGTTGGLPSTQNPVSALLLGTEAGTAEPLSAAEKESELLTRWNLPSR